MEIKPTGIKGFSEVYDDEGNVKMTLAYVETKEKEKSAKEMFEELGYEIDSTCEIEGHLYYCKGYTKIDFDLKRKDFYKYGYCRSPIDMPLLKAINKQVEELGWNNDRV